MTTNDVPSPFAALRTVVRQASHGLVDRDVLVEVIVLTAVAGEHVLVVGLPARRRASRPAPWRARSAAATSNIY